MAKIMTTKEVSEYLKLHEITILKYAAQGKIPAIRIGRVWRFKKEVIDRWISERTKQSSINEIDQKARAQKNRENRQKEYCDRLSESKFGLYVTKYE